MINLSETLRGQLSHNEPLGPYTSWHVGGRAKQFYKPADLADLAQFLAQLPPNEPMVWLGLGSNVLIRDGGIAGTVIMTQGGIQALTALDPLTIRAEAGVTCAKLAKFCAKQQLVEAEFFAGIPGTVGGALAMNAGAYGGETWRHVQSVETIDRYGKIHSRSKADFHIAYREVKGPPDEWFVAGIFQFPTGDAESANQKIRTLLRQRSQTQPIGEFSCGSVFRNPPEGFVGQLIESCGLKGHKIGGAWVSTKHANFIINGGEATAADIENLILTVQATVKEKTGVSIMPECHFLGEKAHG
ncbi:MAG: UDP-N-acetylmuramate dehydrogenase [Gammaproteobacteria bacterium]